MFSKINYFSDKLLVSISISLSNYIIPELLSVISALKIAAF